MEETRIVESQRKASLKNEELELFKQSFIIVPYQVSGFLDYTNKGVVDYVVNPKDFETFKRVWTGNDACVINWKNSLYLQQNENTKELDFKFKLGDFFAGVLETNEAENSISTDESYSDYKRQQIENRVVMRVHKYFEINDYYHFMFYKIPELSGSTLYRIESIEKDFSGTELLGYVITFRTINQELANTGRARQQNIMPNSAGQGYLECEVYDKNWPQQIGEENFKKLVENKDYIFFADRYITANKNKIKHNPAFKVIVKLLGNGILNSFTMIGRPCIRGDSLEKYRMQRILFPYNFTNPSTPNLFHTQANANNFYFGNFTPTLEYYKDLMSSIKDSLTPVNQWKYQGWLKYNYDKLKATNPIEEGKYKYELFGVIEDKVRKDWTFNYEQIKVNTRGSYGCSVDYTIGGNKAIHDHMFDNYWTQKMIKVLPINQYNTLTFGWTLASSIGLIMKGGVISKIFGGFLALIGIAGTLIGKLKPKMLESFRGIISAPLIDFNNSLFANVGGGNNIPFNLIDNNTEDTPNSIFFAGNTLATSFEAKITDLFTCERTPNKVLSTINIGQTKTEDGQNILDNGQTFYVDGDCKLLDSYNHYDGYIIDGFKIQAVFNGEISVEFLDINNEVIWSGVYQSEGKWTNSMREIWTEINTSVFGRENVYYTDPIPYPDEIPAPTDDITNAYSFTVEKPAAFVSNKELVALDSKNGNIVSKQKSTFYNFNNGIRRYYFDILKDNQFLFNLTQQNILDYYENIQINVYKNRYIEEIRSNKVREIEQMGSIETININVRDLFTKTETKDIFIYKIDLSEYESVYNSSTYFFVNGYSGIKELYFETHIDSKTRKIFTFKVYTNEIEESHTYDYKFGNVKGSYIGEPGESLVSACSVYAIYDVVLYWTKNVELGVESIKFIVK